MTTFRHDPADSASLADNVVRPILEDRRGRLWIGTFDGLDLLDRATGKFRHFRHDPADPASISHDEVHYLLEDRRGDIWVGTAVGLNRMIAGADGSVRFKRYTVADGLADDAVAAMLEDDDGNLWISSTTGLSRFAPLTGRWRNYSAGDGTIEGAYFDGSAMKGRDGTLYFGGFNGITAFNPRAISDNLIAPRAVITGFQVFNKPVAQVHPGLLKGPIEHAAEITLDAADSVFSLEFSALHYAAPQRNRFAYQLVGFDENWVSHRRHQALRHLHQPRSRQLHLPRQGGQQGRRLERVRRHPGDHHPAAVLEDLVVPQPGRHAGAGQRVRRLPLPHARPAAPEGAARAAGARAHRRDRAAEPPAREPEAGTGGAPASKPKRSAPRPSSAAPTPSARRRRSSCRRKTSNWPTATSRSCPRSAAR